jgi:L-histidine Nalpha-methyltransferase
MIKPVEILENAYNDRRGVTGKFNRNILSHVNRELRGDFDPDAFAHLAFFNPEREQVEMHLRARRDMQVRIDDPALSVLLQKGETIQTEICRKFRRASAARLFQRSGFTPVRWFTDSREWFSLVELRLDRAGRVAEEEAGNV